MSSGYAILEFSAPTFPDSTLVIQNTERINHWHNSSLLVYPN